MSGWNEEIKKELAFVGDKVFIGNSTIFTNPIHVFLGSRTRIDPFCLITVGLRTGHNVQICSHAVLGGGSQHTIEMGDWTFIGYGSKLFTASEDYSGEYGPVNEFWIQGNKINRGNIKFNHHSGVASNVTVMPGVELPEGCLIAAGSFIYDSSKLEEWSVMIGGTSRDNPLRVMKKRNRWKVLEKANDTSSWKWIKNE